jgi:methylated-DNA-[protein]-cysteine S-methyltransferase
MLKAKKESAPLFIYTYLLNHEGTNNMTKEYAVYESSLGSLYIVAEGLYLTAIYIGQEDFLKEEESEQLTLNPNHQVLTKALIQFEEYFKGNRKSFNLPYKQDGTDFQRNVWVELINIPYGETKSYLDVATNMGKPKAVRAIGQANKANKLPIVVPCHRVIGKNMTLTGYAGSRTDIKEKLLQLEGATYLQNK